MQVRIEVSRAQKCCEPLPHWQNLTRSLQQPTVDIGKALSLREVCDLALSSSSPGGLSLWNVISVVDTHGTIAFRPLCQRRESSPKTSRPRKTKTNKKPVQQSRIQTERIRIVQLLNLMITADVCERERESGLRDQVAVPTKHRCAAFFSFYLALFLPSYYRLWFRLWNHLFDL